MLVKPKHKTPVEKKCGVIYHITCDICDKSYIGETARPMSIRFKEHSATERTIITAIGEHCKNTGHHISWDNVKILSNESSYWRRKIRESIEIRCHNPQLNRDQGMDLPAIYNPFWSCDNLSHDQNSVENQDWRRTWEMSETSPYVSLYLISIGIYLLFCNTLRTCW